MLKRSKHFPHEVELADLTAFRSGWEKLYPPSTTRAKVQERLRGFLRYCYEAKLIDRVPQMSAIKVDEPPTIPLSERQYSDLLAAVQTQFPAAKGVRVYALIRLMRHTGLAIRDAVTLEREELQRDTGKGLHRIVTKRQKTGTHVSVPIPPDVAEALEAPANSSLCVGVSEHIRAEEEAEALLSKCVSIQAGPAIDKS